jgi:hypothetical protein
MGKPGPAPKRAAERRRRNEPSTPVTEVDVAEVTADMPGAQDDPDSLPFKIRQPIVVPTYDGTWPQVERHDLRPDPADGWHPLARDLWDAYSRSGQALFWQPTDWSMAGMLCETITRALQPQIIGYEETSDGETSSKTPIWGPAPVKGSDLAAILKAAAALGLLEGDRRRMGLELTSRYAIEEPKPAPTPEKVADNRRGLFAV